MPWPPKHPCLLSHVQPEKIAKSKGSVAPPPNSRFTQRRDRFVSIMEKLANKGRLGGLLPVLRRCYKRLTGRQRGSWSTRRTASRSSGMTSVRTIRSSLFCDSCSLVYPSWLYRRRALPRCWRMCSRSSGFPPSPMARVTHISLLMVIKLLIVFSCSC